MQEHRKSVHGQRLDRGGLSMTPEYKAWINLRLRCTDPEHPAFANYGGRGVLISDRWRTDFAAFLADVGPRPSNSHSLHRWPDMNGDYEPGNCRWALKRDQKRNVRNKIVLDGKAVTIAEAAGSSSVPEATIRYRLKAGWSPHDAVSKPLKRTGMPPMFSVLIGGEQMSLRQACETFGLRYRQELRRLKEGASFEEVSARQRSIQARRSTAE